jgi:3-oxoacyl-[acyl-carrier protein] reductase
MESGLKGRVALVCAASKGLGKATASGLAVEGARVAICARHRPALEATAAEIRAATGSEVLAIEADLSRPADVAQLVDQTVRHFGRLDILVTNAGGPPPGAFESFSDADWQKAIELSLMVHVRLIRAALPWLKRSKTPSVLTVTSYAVKQPIPNLVLSNAVRAATVGLTKSLALELGSAGIRFNSILPGWTETERVTELMVARA